MRVHSVKDYAKAAPMDLSGLTTKTDSAKCQGTSVAYPAKMVVICNCIGSPHGSQSGVLSIVIREPMQE